MYPRREQPVSHPSNKMSSCRSFLVICLPGERFELCAYGLLTRPVAPVTSGSRVEGIPRYPSKLEWGVILPMVIAKTTNPTNPFGHGNAVTETCLRLWRYRLRHWLWLAVPNSIQGRWREIVQLCRTQFRILCEA